MNILEDNNSQQDDKSHISFDPDVEFLAIEQDFDNADEESLDYGAGYK